MKRLIILFTGIALAAAVNAQTLFFDKAVIEYEQVTNFKKTMGNSIWAERMGENMPALQKSNYTLTIDGNKTEYKFKSWVDKEKLPIFMQQENKSVWYTDFSTNSVIMNKDMFGSLVDVQDSIRNLEWKLLNENRFIAGFNCKKAVTKIFDSVYVYAFYTEEIITPAGPASIAGLPGTILGLTIPRLYSSWIATKVNVTGPTAFTWPKAPSKPFKNGTAITFIDERTKDWWSGAETEEERIDNAQTRARFIWNILL
jgi:GLPGLI family protein